jgi:integrase/recombinase XerD
LLYCTGIRFGEALRLHIGDVDTRSAVLFVKQFKGRARWVPFHRSLASELDCYLKARHSFAPALADDCLFVGANKKTLPIRTASQTLRTLFRKAGMKPMVGRVGPRPYDLRHAFAMHRLALWYRQGADLHARLPWLSAYMGHDNILGTQTYLSATPELLALAGNRMRHQYLHSRKAGNHYESAKEKHSPGFSSELFP